MRMFHARRCNHVCISLLCVKGLLWCRKAAQSQSVLLLRNVQSYSNSQTAVCCGQSSWARVTQCEGQAERVRLREQTLQQPTQFILLENQRRVSDLYQVTGKLLSKYTARHKKDTF